MDQRQEEVGTVSAGTWAGFAQRTKLWYKRWDSEWQILSIVLIIDLVPSFHSPFPPISLIASKHLRHEFASCCSSCIPGDEGESANLTANSAINVSSR